MSKIIFLSIYSLALQHMIDFDFNTKNILQKINAFTIWIYILK